MKTPSGAYIFEIAPNEKVNNSQIILGDIIVQFDSKPVATVDNLHKYLNEDLIDKKLSL